MIYLDDFYFANKSILHVHDASQYILRIKNLLELVWNFIFKWIVGDVMHNPVNISLPSMQL